MVASRSYVSYKGPPLTPSYIDTSAPTAIVGPHGGGRVNLTDPNPVSEDYIPPDASPAPPPSSDSLSTSSCGSSCTEAVEPVPIITAKPPSLPGTVASAPTVIANPPSLPGSGAPVAAPPGISPVSTHSVPPATAPRPTITVPIARPPGSGVPSGGGSSDIPFYPSSSSLLPSSFSNSSVKWSNYSTPTPTTSSSLTTRFDNKTVTVVQIPTSSSSYNAWGCTPLQPGQDVTIWSILPNTTTITLTVTGNQSVTYSSTPEWIPPTMCPEPVIPFATYTLPKESSSTQPIPYAPISFNTQATPRATTTFLTTAKNPPVVTVPALYPSYPDGSSDKQSLTDGDTYIDTYVWGPATFPGFPASVVPIPITQIINEDLSYNAPITYVLDDGVTVMVGSNVAVIGGQTYTIGPSMNTITQGADVFTIGPSQVLGPMLVAYVPTAGGIFSQAQTTVNGVPIFNIGPTSVVVGGTTFTIGAGAPTQTGFYDGKTITFGPGGVMMDHTTIAPPPVLPTNNIVIGGEVFSAIGSTIAVIHSTTFTYGPGVPVTTEVVDGDTITLGPSGITFDGKTLGGPGHPTGTQLGVVGGVSITEIGSTLAVVDGVTITIGPGVKPMTTVINGHTLTIGPSGLGVGSATLSFPFNPTTQAVTAGGITFSEIGSTLVVLGGKTYTIGPGAKPTTDVYNGQTISIGPNGVGFKTTTFTGATATSTSTKKKNGAAGLRARKVYGVLGTCIVVGVGYLI